jgi:hypothetical protein
LKLNDYLTCIDVQKPRSVLLCEAAKKVQGKKLV